MIINLILLVCFLLCLFSRPPAGGFSSGRWRRLPLRPPCDSSRSCAQKSRMQTLKGFCLRFLTLKWQLVQRIVGSRVKWDRRGLGCGSVLKLGGPGLSLLNHKGTSKSSEGTPGASSQWLLFYYALLSLLFQLLLFFKKECSTHWFPSHFEDEVFVVIVVVVP